MRLIHFSDARNQFKQVIDQVASDYDVTIISCEGGKAVVLMPEGIYNSMMETLHLFKSSANAKDLNASVAQYRQR